MRPRGFHVSSATRSGRLLIDRKTGLPYPGLAGHSLVAPLSPEDGHDLILRIGGRHRRTDIPRAARCPFAAAEESAFCAGCHYGILGGVVVGNMETKGGVLVYSSFSEWLESPYSDEETGKTCQDCHMRARRRELLRLAVARAA